MALNKRAPSAKLAKQRRGVRKMKKTLGHRARDIEAKHRKAGGYGKAVVSIYEAPKGGLKNSPAYATVLRRSGAKTLPPPKDRAGAPIKGGFPVSKLPVNCVVDVQREFWLPDNWCQTIKNTGGGGTYLGWISPEGKFHYHKSGYPTAVDDSIGRTLNAVDGFNGILRSVRDLMKKDCDKIFLRDTLTNAERKHIRPAADFHFGVVSARRAHFGKGQHSIMLVEAYFHLMGIKPTWYVDADSLADYTKLGLKAVVGGKLTPSRNMALDDAKKKKKVCVQVSDDISQWRYYDCEKQDFRGEKDFSKANAALWGTRIHTISPLAAAQFMLAKMRSDPAKPKVCGVSPTGNASMMLGQAEFNHKNFILGDFFVAEPSSPIRFDTNMTLKEDYDYSCSHIKQHGSALRCNRMILMVQHSTNEGGAVSNRDAAGTKEQRNIAILQDKWPGVFSVNVKRKDEVLMRWKDNSADQAEAEEKDGKEPRRYLVNGAIKKLKAGVTSKSKGLLKVFPLTAYVHYTGKSCDTDYIMKRLKRCNGMTVNQCVGLRFRDAKNKWRVYGFSDLKYDILCGRLRITKLT